MARSAAGRFGWGLADQAVCSLTNFALSILVARSVHPEDFGAFTLAFAVYLFVLGLSRALGTDPLAVRFSNSSREDFRRASCMSTARP
jgi:O-antigen/teichoic acid export membrane protein